MNFKYHPAQLAQLQALPLDLKVYRALMRIREWLDAWDGDAYVSFSGGKDSLVLAHLVRQVARECRSCSSTRASSTPN